MQKQKSKLGSAGFTLIELLIVIIIIGILAAIAFIAYSGATNKANQAAAQSNLEESRNKLGEYNADDGYYPTSMTTFTTWLQSSTGGNNTSLATTLGSAEYTYTASPANCDNSATNCTGYSMTAAGSYFGGSNITVTN